MQYREGTAGIVSRSQTSGVHKDSCAARGLGARVLASSSKDGGKAGVPRSSSCANIGARTIKSRDDHVEKKNAGTDKKSWVYI